MFAMAAEAGAHSGAGPSLRAEIEAAADGLDAAHEGIEELAREIAQSLEGKFAVVYGAGPTIPVAARWKTEINENAKLMAAASELPEADHNEIEGWAGGADTVADLAAVFLADPDQHPREKRRIELTATTIEGAGLPVVRVESAGESRSERLLWSVMLGDLVSVELADLRGVAPEPVEVLEGFKRDLGRPEEG
jgi:glucose/mannose-6-phosphate isomerase